MNWSRTNHCLLILLRDCKTFCEPSRSQEEDEAVRRCGPTCVPRVCHCQYPIIATLGVVASKPELVKPRIMEAGLQSEQMWRQMFRGVMVGERYSSDIVNGYQRFSKPCIYPLEGAISRGLLTRHALTKSAERRVQNGMMIWPT